MKRIEFFIFLLLIVFIADKPLIVYSSERYVNEFNDELTDEDTAPCVEVADVPEEIYDSVSENEAGDNDSVVNMASDPTAQNDDFVPKYVENTDTMPANDGSDSVFHQQYSNSEDIAADPMPEEVTGSSSYFLKVVWLDNGTRLFNLGTCRSLAEAKTNANSILNSIGLAGRCTVNAAGNAVTATVKKPDAINFKDISVIAHMGFIKYAPDNTLSSIRIAAACGYKDVEFDVQFTKDGVPVLQHDYTINRCGRNPDGSTITQKMYIEDLTYAELLNYDFGVRRGSVWKSEKIATLDEALSVCARSGVKPHIDMKNVLTPKTAESIYMLVDKHGLKGRVNYLSIFSSSLKLIIEHDQDSDYTIVVHDMKSNYLSEAEKLKKMVRSRVHLYIHRQSLTEKVARTCRFHSIPIDTSVDSASEIVKLDKWVKRINTTNILPATVLENAAKRKPYSVKSYTGEILAGKDYGLYASNNCGLCVHMTSSMPDRAVVLGNTDSLAEMNDFRFERLKNGLFRIVSTRCMLALAPNAGGKIVLKKPSSNDAAQQWKVRLNSNRTYTLTNSAYARTLHWESAVEGASLILADPDGSDSEQFFFAFAPKQVKVNYSGKLYRFMSAAGTGYSIGIKGGSVNECANAIITKTNTAYRAQKFSLVYSGDGFYRIINDYSKKCLELRNGVVIQSEWKNKSSQRWKIVDRKEGGCTVECKSGGRMCVQGSVLAYGRLISRVNSYNGNKYQRWIMKTT